MSTSREQILGRIRRKLGAENRAQSERAVAQRLKNPGPQGDANPIPDRAQGKNRDERLKIFRDRAERVNCTVAGVSSLDEVPAAIADYLAERNLPSSAVMSPDSGLDGIPWDNQPLLTVRRGRSEDSDAVGITPVVAGVAETGTLVMLSGAETPTTINLTPDTHVAVVRTSQIVGTYEETWAELRRREPRSGDGNFMPRTVNWITGPSRTADIAKTIFLGAHGPRQIHIVLVDDGGAEEN